ncbi:MAG: hypothetical protein GX307_07040 [Euryarchaeota archaeon]|nr:hypothetical protein [Euryarchaeota archaeon]
MLVTITPVTLDFSYLSRTGHVLSMEMAACGSGRGCGGRSQMSPSFPV